MVGTRATVTHDRYLHNTPISQWRTYVNKVPLDQIGPLILFKFQFEYTIPAYESKSIQLAQSKFTQNLSLQTRDLEIWTWELEL